MTLIPAAYFAWVLAGAVSLYTRLGATSVYPMYIIFTLTILMLAGVAFAVYRGHRWPLYFYLIVALGGCFDLVTVEPMLWEKTIPLLRNRPHPWGEFEWNMVFNLLYPVVQLAGALYCTIAIYLKTWVPSGYGIAGEKRRS